MNKFKVEGIIELNEVNDIHSKIRGTCDNSSFGIKKNTIYKYEGLIVEMDGTNTPIKLTFIDCATQHEIEKIINSLNEFAKDYVFSSGRLINFMQMLTVAILSSNNAPFVRDTIHSYASESYLVKNSFYMLIKTLISKTIKDTFYLRYVRRTMKGFFLLLCLDHEGENFYNNSELVFEKLETLAIRDMLDENKLSNPHMPHDG